MECRNYYHFSDEELVQALHEIREWLFIHEKHPSEPKAVFALEVALDAQALKRDPFVQTVIDTVT